VGLLGSPGGNAIPAYIAKTLLAALDWRLPLQQAIDLPNLVARGAQFNGDVGTMKPEMVQELARRGVTGRSGSGEDSGLHGVLWRGGRWDVGADSRREGVVLYAGAD
jgi:gamma-glutamyltranspeptidase/glutathione hydrolase